MKVLIHLIALASSTLAAAGQQPAASIEVPQGARVIREAKGDGVQIYTCSQPPEHPTWMLTRPDARLLDSSERPIGTHFAGPTWKLTDGGEVQGVLMPPPKPSPDKDSIPWLLLRAKEGTAKGSLGSVAFITRTETHGGVSPTKGCKTPRDIGKTTQVHYTAKDTFYAEK